MLSLSPGIKRTRLAAGYSPLAGVLAITALPQARKLEQNDGSARPILKQHGRS
jgi:hypothetical protein